MHRIYTVLLLLISASCVAQTAMPSSKYYGVSIEASRLADYQAGLIEDAFQPDLFAGVRGVWPSLTLMRGDTSSFVFLSTRFAFLRNRTENQVQKVNSDMDPVEGEFALESRLRSEILMDFEIGKQYVHVIHGVELSAGPSVYVGLARSKSEIDTENDLSAYVDEFIRFTTRTRGETGLRLRAAASRRIAHKFRLTLSASFQAGLRSLPDLNYITPQSMFGGQTSLVRSTDERNSLSFELAENVVPMIQLTYLFR